MRATHILSTVCAILAFTLANAVATESTIDLRQVPKWSSADLDFFLHGSMSTEVIPERVFNAFIATYPDLFPAKDLSNFGLMSDPAVGWPIGISRRGVPHLGGLPSIGVDCAACHVSDVKLDGRSVRVLGMTSHFDAEAFFGSIVVATFRTADAENMKRYLVNYLENGSSTTAEAQLDLFHQMRAALHIPDQPPDKAPPASGPGRNDAFGLLSAGLFGVPQPYAPVKFGLVWNLDHRRWVHWDGNTQSPIGRNLLASLGLGAPLIGKRGILNFADVKRQTDLAEQIRAPRYPLKIDLIAAKEGAHHYKARCAQCHDGSESDRRLRSTEQVGTEPQRAQLFTQHQADLFNKFLADLETPGYQPPKQPGLRSTQKYWSPSLAGVWARSPYLHNGSVRTMQELLTRPETRAQVFHRGSRDYDPVQMGYADAGPYLFDTVKPGNSNAGHNFGTDLSDGQKRELIEYLKTL